MRLTVFKMERALRYALDSGMARVRVRPLKDCGQVDTRKNPAPIDIDPHRAPIGTLIHELIHLVYCKELEKWGALEEPIVLALEVSVESFINRKEARVRWWRQRIDEAQEE